MLIEERIDKHIYTNKMKQERSTCETPILVDPFGNSSFGHASSLYGVNSNETHGCV